MQSVNWTPKLHLLIQGASGFKPPRLLIVSSRYI